MPVVHYFVGVVMHMNIEKYRKKRGITRSRLASDLHVSETAVYKWENGLTMPRGARLTELSSILGCSIEQLFSPCADEVKESNDILQG